jgi:glycerol-1-phosphate dehydrogenase [NAD(P)+]
VGALFCAYLRGDDGQAGLISACLSRHGLPRTPGDIGLSHGDFVKAVALAPGTRPGRYTILERLALSDSGIADRVEDYAGAISG